ncbi:MAG: argininosuccinate lyase [Thermodesulfobacteriota bacterium]|nr:argininosuccinate lyase [Thermodesulfobacteriota bacterium]
MKEKLWGGRFKSFTDKNVDAFNASIDFDKRLWKEDIEGNLGYCKMLGKAGIIGKDEVAVILNALKEIYSEIERGDFLFDESMEDIHTHIEKALIEKVGHTGETIHTGRSRNDQVALDTRLYVRNSIIEIDSTAREFQLALIDVAEDHIDLIMPGYTHLQRAQPVLLAHHLLAYYEMLKRDRQRYKEALKRTNILPLGSAALAGTTFNFDREFLSQELKMDGITSNSMDAVSDRDFAAEFIFASSLLMMHLSRLCEELIIWSTTEFNFIEISDSFATGSSIMPQKKNPDIPELIRGKTGRVYGNLISLLTTMKGIPLTYNKDMQEDKEPLFDTVDTVKKSLKIFAMLLKEISFKRDNLYSATEKGYLVATDLADYLVKKGMTFRKAHNVVGDIILSAQKKGRELYEMNLNEMKKFSALIEEDVYKALDPVSCINNRNIAGGTGAKVVRDALIAARKDLKL